MKVVKAKLTNKPYVSIWGTGSPVREWLYVDDGAEALIRGLDLKPSSDIINIGVGRGISILELANKIKNILGYTGKLVLDKSKPDGAPFKTVDGSKGAKIFGWKPSVDLETGLKNTIAWYLKKGEKSG